MKIKQIVKKTFLNQSTYVHFNFKKNEECLKEKNVLIMGGSSGIGYSVASRLIQFGANVIITGRSLEKLQNASEKLKCDFLQWDISDTDCIGEKIQNLDEKVNHKLDCVIHCAGVYQNVHFDNCKLENWNFILNTNLKGPYFALNSIIQTFFIDKQVGNVILIGSNRGLIGDDGPYGISKAAFIHYGKGLAKVLLPFHIRVNIINPGMTASEINGIKDTDDLYNKTLMGKRVISSKEIAEIVSFFVSDASTCITGQVLNCDNGESLL